MPLDVASTMSFAFPSLSCGVVLTPAVKFQVDSLALDGCAICQTE